jgi:hypothetical protein
MKNASPWFHHTDTYIKFTPSHPVPSFHQSTKICSDAHSAFFALANKTSFFGSKVAMA